jgi:deazaflavin-dependent oxidoreductase (nitroreductase family)
MPLPRWLAKLNRRVTNPILGVVARRVPPFAILRHRGRVSGKVYETPIMVFRRDGVAVIALTYGPSADWVRNVLAAGSCQLVLRGTASRWVAPAVVHTPEVTDRLPLVVRLALRLLRSDEFLWLRAA